MSKNSTPVLNGVYEAISELIGFDNTTKLYKHFAGSQINFPTRLFSKEFVLSEAVKAYDGTSESINRSFEFTEKYILKKCNREETYLFGCIIIYTSKDTKNAQQPPFGGC